MKNLVWVETILALALMVTVAHSQQSIYHRYIQKLLDSNIKTWLQAPVVIESIKTQNTKHANLQQDQILSLDKKWKTQRTSKKKPLINAVLANPLSTFLKEIKEKNGDLFSEIFVMDNKGLNVGQSDITSDYWQGDEAKWQQTYLVGPEGLVIGDREFDDSSSKFLIQISVSVTDPESQEVIGAATIGVSLAKLLRASTVAITSR